MRYVLCTLAVASSFAAAPPIAVVPPVYGDHTTHKMLTERAVRLASRSGYRELAVHSDVIRDGCIAEDEKPRYLNHFFDPATGLGLPRNSYSLLFTGQRPRRREASIREMNAFDWAKDGMSDDKDWDGALAAYDDTSAARNRAYDALGHVVHLLQDMAQPDHATCRQHPGNYAHDQIAELSATAAEYLVPSNRVGYETLWAKNDGKWPEGKTPQKPRDLNDAFRTMGNASKAAETELGLLNAARGEKALGLRSYRSARARSGAGNRAREAVGEVLSHALGETFALWDLVQYRKFADNHWLDMEVHVPIVPIIPWPETAETKPYLELGRKLLPLAEEASAGLIQYFHDIVNPPPFVESVAIEQSGEPRYFARWQDTTLGERVVSRALVKELSKPLLPAVPGAILRIRFGPYVLVNGVEHRETLRDVRVWIEPAGASSDNATPAAGAFEIRGRFVPGAGGSQTEIWEGWFTPQIGGTLRIQARDRDAHLERRSPLGDVLDSEPGDVARSGVAPPYDWSGYQPGADRNHAIALEGQCSWCTCTDEQRRTLRAGTWQGEITTREEYRRDERWDLVYETTIHVSFRALAKRSPWDEGVPMVSLQVGGAEGSYATRWKRGGDEPLQSASGPVGVTGFLQLLPAPDGDRHKYWVNFQLQLPEDLALGEMADSGTYLEAEASPSGELAGELSEERGSRRRTQSWSFAFTAGAPPPHAALWPRIDEDEAQDLQRYQMRLWNMLDPYFKRLTLAEAPISQRIQQLMIDAAVQHAEANQSGMSDRKSAIDRLYDEAQEAWLSEEPGREDALYASKQRELEQAVEAWYADRRSVERLYAQFTDELAGVVEPKAPELAQELRKLAQELREKGSENLGGGSR